MISLNNIISYFYKYAQLQSNELSLQEEIDIDDAIQYILKPILESKFQIGKDKANEILTYLNQKKSTNVFKKFVDASYIDQIIGNLVYQHLPDQQIQTLISQLLDVLKDQDLAESGSFTNQLIKPSIDRWKTSLTKTNPAVNIL